MMMKRSNCIEFLISVEYYLISRCIVSETSAKLLNRGHSKHIILEQYQQHELYPCSGTIYAM